MPLSALPSSPAREIRDSVVIRFAGDSGDGMQVTGTQFMLETALAGNDLSTFPDFPAEIRAPAGTTFGVSAFGLLLWMYGRERTATVEWLKQKFAKKPQIADANIAALNAGHAFGETAEMPEHLVGYVVPKADVQPGLYRTVSGTEALAWGLVAGLRASGIGKLVFAGYPITPASALLHTLANLRAYGVVTFQAEDEIAASGAALGASYAGALGVTSSSGPGIALKTEMLGLAIATELPLVVVDSQRAGPSTGMPTKAEQSDLFQAVHGRNADAPLAVIAAASTADCFDVAIEAVR